MKPVAQRPLRRGRRSPAWAGGEEQVHLEGQRPADPEDSKPQPCWRTNLCETRELRPGEQRYRHHLLTLAGSQVVYCSHSGAIVAVDALGAGEGRRVKKCAGPTRALKETQLSQCTCGSSPRA